MTTNQMDILAGVILLSWFELGKMSYKEAIAYYTAIRDEISYWNEGKTNDEGRVEDEHTE